MSLPKTLTLSRATSGTAVPFSVGHTFVKGDVPAGQSVISAQASSFQCVAKNTWNDGSLKFAILSGTADFTGGTPLNLSLTTGAANSGSALTTTNLKATGITASISTTLFGSASWSDIDWDTPFQSWVSGPVMSSWIFRKQIGTDAHLVAWLEVRLYSTGDVDVLPWIENGYINVASPGQKQDVYTFTLGGTQRFSANIDLRHHQRTVLISGTNLDHWLGTDPAVLALHDTNYIQSTELVPTYGSNPASTLPNDRYSVSGFTPLQQGDFKFGASGTGYGGSDNMADTGYSRCIGLLPEWEVLHLKVRNQTTYNLVIRNAYGAGRYGIHYRDENTNRPLRFSQYPTLTIRDGQAFNHAGSSTTNSRTLVISGPNPPTWDTAHSPSIGYFAYLITGRWYFMEQCQFAATVNYLGNGSGPELRDGAKGLTQPCDGAWQTRDCAWMWRALAQALTITPDNDTVLKTEFQTSVQHNIDHFYNRYVAQANNPFGIIQQGAGYPYLCNVPIWQQDFVTASFGYTVSLELPLNTTYLNKLGSFFQWTAQSVTGRLSTFASGGYPYNNAAIYLINISSTGNPNWANGTGPWHANWSEVYAAHSFIESSFGGNYSWRATSDDGTLHGEIMPGATSQWGNLNAALAYAVRHNVPGAADGLARIQAASNYSALTTEFNTIPVWSITPAAATTGGAVVAAGSPPFGKSIRIDTADYYTNSVVIGDTGLGVLGSLIRANTATGGAGPGAIYPCLTSADDDHEVMLRISTPPASGNLFVNEDGSFTHSGVTQGTITWIAGLYDVGVSVGDVTITDQFGQLSVFADRNQTYYIRTFVQRDLAETYRIYSGIAQNLVQQYNILSSTITDLTLSFAITAAMQQIFSELAQSYRIRTATQADLQANYNFLTPVQLDKIHQYLILEGIEKDLGVSYIITSIANVDLQIGYYIDGIRDSSSSIGSGSIDDLSQKYSALIDQLQVLNSKLNIFINGDENATVEIGGGKVVKSIAGISKQMSELRFVARVKDHKLLDDAEFDDTIADGMLVRIWGDTSELNGIYKMTNGSLDKISFADLYDLSQG